MGSDIEASVSGTPERAAFITGTKLTIFGVLIVAIIAGGFYAYQFYQGHHLSSDLRRTLTAGMDPSATEADEHVYIRDARLQIRTRKDAMVLNQFETCFRLFKDAEETNSRLLNDSLQSLHNLTSDNNDFNRLIEMRSEYWREHVPVPKDLQARIDQFVVDEKARHKQEDEVAQAERKRVDEEEATARKLYTELRSELGLPPVKQP